MRFVDPELEEQVRRLDWRLRDHILPDVDDWADRRGYDLWVTCVIRDDGVHGAKTTSGYRAVDTDLVARDSEVSQMQQDEFGRYSAIEINQRWRYGRSLTGRPLKVALWHENRGTVGFHLHLQVPDGALSMLP